MVSLSEGLRVELAPRGIGVSVLCPGFIKTNIVTSARNLPSRFGAPAPAVGAGGELPTWLSGIRDRVSAGIDPLYVGDLVREAIEGDWPYIFTDNEFEPFVDMRFAGIKAGFERIRDRTPKR